MDRPSPNANNITLFTFQNVQKHLLTVARLFNDI